jgi:hypothetical protein
VGISRAALFKAGALPVLALLGTASGCAQEAVPLPSVANGDSTADVRSVRAVQIIIKFRRESLDASDERLLTELSRDAGTRLRYLRPLSGGAHVLQAQDLRTPEQLDRLIRRLAERADVEYVEADRRMFPQPSR